ncbi:MAG: DUF4329 domain-containing protein [Pseudomonadales bacterium]
MSAPDGILAVPDVTQSYDSGDKRAQITALTTATFDSPLAAVLAAENEYNPLSIAQDREFIGAVLRHHGVYRYTVGQGLTGEDTVTVRLAVPRGAEIVAFWHTHGAAGHGRNYFSAVDTALVNSWNKPFYMADYSGTLRVFNPGDATMTAMKARRLGLGDRSGYAKGRVVMTEDSRRARVATSLLAQR